MDALFVLIVVGVDMKATGGVTVERSSPESHLCVCQVEFPTLVCSLPVSI